MSGVIRAQRFGWRDEAQPTKQPAQAKPVKESAKKPKAKS